ncbi:MAG: gliding motility-associated C-terminal domain-containing protein [Bacteroidota bacterium]
MNKIQNYLLIVFIAIFSISYAQRGKDGNATINTPNRIVNEYTTLTANASAGSVSINVLASGLNTNNRFSGNLAPGDLIMIIQMQGAAILGIPDTATTTSNPNDATWGSIVSYNNCGNYELRQVATVPNSTTITIDCGLTNNYTALGKVQIIRVPRYNTLTINTPGILTCDAWNGVTGGVLAVESFENITINNGGKISVSGKGFRGAALFTPSSPRSQTLWYSSTSLTVSANKGEGIAGYDIDYITYGGKYCRGAAANAGGGGNVWNSGGGGGANAGSIGSWTGQGNPDISNSGWTSAWNLESPGFASSTSSGGGRGGYSFSGSNEDATVDPPNSLVWGGYARVNVGGLGGRPLDYSTGRIFMGGGGGGGEQDNNQGGAGGAGGGIIYFTSYGTINGAGNDSIKAEGNPGGDSYISPPLTSYSGKDGAGGGGGGGTILLNSLNANGLILSTKGGKGGDQLLTRGSFYFGAMNEAEGPGGGGGGGYIAITSGTVTQIADGGKNGTTNSDGLTEFPPNGATKGGAGMINQSLPVIDTLTANDVTICSGDSAVLYATINGSIHIGLTWYDSPSGGIVLGTDTLATPALTDTTIFYAGVCPSTYRIPVVVTVLPANPSINIVSDATSPVCPGTLITFTATPMNEGVAPSYQWKVNGATVGTNSPTYSSSTLLNGDSVICILTPNSGCAAGIAAISNSIVIAISPNITASIIIAANPSNTICAGTSVTFTATPANGGINPTYQWKLNGTNVGGNSITYNNSALANGDVLTCILTSNENCVLGSPATSNTITMAVNPLPLPVFTSDINTGCTPLCIQFSLINGSNYSSVNYNFGDGNSSATTSPQHCYTQIGSFSVDVLCTDLNNCTGTTTISNMITVASEPTAAFTVSPANLVTANTSLTFTNTSLNSSSYIWNFADPSSGLADSSTVTSPAHVYTTEGIYCITLIAQNQAGCVDTTNECITVTNEATLMIPNMFTPNGDGKNDLFYITTTAIRELSCCIYDRWGTKVTEWNTLTGSWNGRSSNDRIMQDGVYFYVVKATTINEKTLNEKGFIQLLKDK